MHGNGRGKQVYAAAGMAWKAGPCAKLLMQMRHHTPALPCHATAMSGTGVVHTSIALACHPPSHSVRSLVTALLPLTASELVLKTGTCDWDE